jgi:predicted O-methyltransferase YrrM
MGPRGKLYTFELEPAHAEVARESFKKAEVSDQVEIFVGPALDNLDKISNLGPFDLVFIDADKVSYPSYLKWAAQNLRSEGIVIADNTFAWGTIANDHFESGEEESAAKALREFNQMAAKSGLFRSTILPTGEGLTVAVKTG